MNTEQILALIEQGVHNMTGFVYGEYDPEEIYQLFNTIMRRYVTTMPLAEAEKLTGIVNTNKKLSGRSLAGNVTKFDKPAGFLRSLGMEFLIDDDCGKDTVTGREKYTETNKDLKINHLYRSDRDSPVYIVSDKVNVYFKVDEAYMDYLETPRLLSADNPDGVNLPDYTVDEIISQTVQNHSVLIEASQRKVQNLERENLKY